MRKRILSLALSILMILSVVPMSLVAQATVSANNVTISDIADSTVLGKLTVSASVDTALTTQFGIDDFSERCENNLLGDATEFAMYTNATQDTKVTFQDGSSVTWAKAAMCDGIIPASTTTEPGRLTGKSSLTAQSMGYLTIGFDSALEIGDMYIVSRDNGKDSLYDYEIYVSENREDLYNQENMLVDFLYEGYTTVGNVGKINKTTVDGVASTYVAEVEDFKFSKPVTAKYVGIKMNSFSKTGYIRIYEIGIEEFTNVTNTDIKDSTVKEKLSVSAAVPVTLTTQFGKDDFAARSKHNLLSSAAEFAMYTDNTQKTEVTTSSGSAITWSKANMSDGAISHNIDGVDTESPRLTGSHYNKNSQSYGYLTIGFSASKEIHDIYIATRDNGKDSLYDYEIYVSDTRADLYSEENLIIDFLYEGYTVNGYVGKINKTTVEGAVTSYVAEAEDYRFAKPINGQYVGIKMNSYSRSGYLRICEIGVESEILPESVTTNVTNTDISDSAVKSKLTVGATIPTTLTTQFDENAFAERFTNNLLSSATEFAMYTDATQTTEVTFQDDGSITWAKAAMHDGVIPVSTKSEPTRLTGKSTKTTETDGYLTIALDQSYDIGDIYIACSEYAKDSLYDYEIYASETREDLYHGRNLLVDFLYEGYTTNNYTGKINKSTVNDDASTYVSEVEDYKFAKPVTASYVGIKMNSFSKTNYIRVYEIGIEEFQYFKLDESELNVNMHILPLEDKITDEIVDEYSFKVSVDNGGVLNHLYADGEEITPDEDGIYTLLNATRSTKLTADLTLDTKRTVYLGVGGNETERNLNWQTTSNTIGKVQYAEKAGDEFPVQYFEATANVSLSHNMPGYYVNKATIKNLKPDTEYVYRVVNDEVSETYSFKTDSKSNFSFLYGSDPQLGSHGLASGISKWNASMDKIAANFTDSNLLVIGGDQVDKATSEDMYDAYFGPEELTSFTTATTIGNHDSPNYSYTEHFYNPNTSFDGVVYGATEAGGDYWFVYNNILFMNINTNSYQADEHRAFIEKAVAANPDVTWRVVVTHVCVYTGGSYYNTTAITNRREFLVPIFTEFDIDVVLSGHNHVYTRTYMMNEFEPQNQNGVQSKVTNPEGILYITGGTISGTKYYDPNPDTPDYAAVNWQEKSPCISQIDVTETSLKLTAYNLDDMSVIDEFEIEKTSAHTHSPEHVAEDPATCTKEGSAEHWYCEGCDTKFSDETCQEEITDIVIPVLGHDWQIDREGGRKFCANDCGEEIFGHVVTFVGKRDKIIYEAIVEDGNPLSPEDVKAAGETAPMIYGYTFVGWNNGTDTIIMEDTAYTAVYKKNETKYTVVINYVSKENETLTDISFDARLTVTDPAATQWTINDSVVAIGTKVVLYAPGDMEISASAAEVNNQPGVTVTHDVAIANVNDNTYATFAHVNTCGRVVKEIGFIYITGTTYRDLLDSNDENFKMAKLDAVNGKYDKGTVSSVGTDFMVSYNGIPKDSLLKRYARAYVIFEDDENIYYSNVVSKTFNGQ